MKKILTISLPKLTDAALLNLAALIALLATAWFLSVNLGNRSGDDGFNRQSFGGGPGDSTIINAVSPVPYDIVFVSRKILKQGSNYQDTLGDMGGVGCHSRFRNCAPGKLQIYKTNGTVVTLIDGSNPTAASLNLIDVNGPEVNYYGKKIVFAGLPAPPPGQSYDTMPKGDLGAWRIYRINVDGTGLTQLTFTDVVINSSQFNLPGETFNDFSKYDDIDPVWMPDGRICFSSSRNPSIADHSTVRTTNLWVMNANGSGMHRITSERNAAERPIIDPLTGKIIFSRWWRNNRWPIDAMNTVANSSGTGFIRKDGLTSNSYLQSYEPNLLMFNGWTPTEINPDGTELELFAGGKTDGDDYMMYGGSFNSEGDLVSNYFPQPSLVYESGFGGIVKHPRGAGLTTPLAGYANLQSPVNPPLGLADSLWRYYSVKGFASDAYVLPDDRIIYSYASDYNQQYGLYVMNANGGNKTLIYDEPGTAQLRAKAIHHRPKPPIIQDQNLNVPFLYPPLAAGPYDNEGTFIFNCLNVYANGPVDMNITSAVKIGDAGSIRFYINHQRTRKNSDPELEWPILLDEMPVSPSGAVLNTAAPANQPLFEQMRTPVANGYKVPVTGLPFASSTAYVAGMNYGKPGATVTCVGCHRGHTLIPIPSNHADAEFTNLAPGADVTVSSYATNSRLINYINDRSVRLAMDKGYYWISAGGSTTNQWVRLKFPVSIKIKTVRVYNIPFGGLKNSTLQVTSAIVNIYADDARTQLVASKTVNQNISETGTDVNFNNVIGKVVEVKPLTYTGVFGGWGKVIGLAEVEVIASGDVSTPRIGKTNNENLQCDIYPNPSNDITYLNLQSSVDGVINYTVYNTSSAAVIKKELNATKDIPVKERIDLTNQPAGVYMVSVRTGTAFKVVKVIKL